jgi:hypothetical protein
MICILLIVNNIQIKSPATTLVTGLLFGVFVGLPGFEPRQTEPKSVVLPLYYRPIRKLDCKNKVWQHFPQIKTKVKPMLFLIA